VNPLIRVNGWRENRLRRSLVPMDLEPEPAGHDDAEPEHDGGPLALILADVTGDPIPGSEDV
jgi:hypothetical protein